MDSTPPPTRRATFVAWALAVLLLAVVVGVILRLGELEELVRLGLARVEPDDHVVLTEEQFVPSHDEGQMLDFLSANVGDHLRAAVDNAMQAMQTLLGDVGEVMSGVAQARAWYALLGMTRAAFAEVPNTPSAHPALHSSAGSRS